jgi:GGDEF domain-containing protein
MTPDEDTLITAHARVAHALEAAWARGVAQSSPLALLLVALDGGEQAAGAAVVGTLERALRVHCGRDRDIVLRRRHDEFLALLPDTPPAGARRVGEQIVEAMHQGDSTTTVSVGVVVAVPDEQHSATDLLHRAEAILRSAQNHGGDGVQGGVGTGTRSPARPKTLLATLRDLLPKKKQDPNLKRRSD